MTLLPSNEFGVVGVKGPHYVPEQRCAAPGCEATVGDVHHLFSRSLKGTYSWIQFPDGHEVGNLVRLCREHHSGITGETGAGHRWWIKWSKERRLFIWGRVVGDDPAWPKFSEIAPLDPQPPAPKTDVSQPVTESEPDRCPSCGQRRRRAPAISKAGARRRKSWLIKVPDDHEDGAAVLDTLVDDLSPLLGYDADKNTRYHTVAAVLVFAQQDKRAFRDAVVGVGGHREA